MEKMKLMRFLIKLILLIFYFELLDSKPFKKKRIGVISLYHSQNVGNFLVKFAIFNKLKEYNFEPIIICPTNRDYVDVDFLNRNVKYKLINKSFSELKEKDYDFLIVNSDQTWNVIQNEYLYDYGFLKFAQNWTIPKFTYAASLGVDFWRFSKEFDRNAKKLLKNFTGVSVREIGAVNMVQKHFGFKPTYVLDPTFIIDKKYYLDVIKDFKRDFNFNDKYIFVYQLDINEVMKDFINEASNKFKYKIFKVDLSKPNFIENFLFGVNMSQAIVTDSFHGTAFSIIFNKPFISYINSIRGRLRFYSLQKTFALNDRIIFPDKNYKPDINLLNIPLNINQDLLDSLRNFSINYLKKNLHIY
jgi:hypothetical protein